MPTKGQILSYKSVIALIASVILFAFSFLPNYEIFERRLLDLSFKIRGAETPHPDLVIVEINDQSLKRIGSWPWPRSFHAALLKVLREQDPKAIFFDMIFSEASNEQDDLVLSYEMEEAGNVILPYYFPAKNRKEIFMKPEGLPIETFQEKAKALGYVNAFPDIDGYVRELPLTLHKEGHRFMNASLAMSSIYANFSEEDFEKFDHNRKTIYINFPGPYSVFRTIPFEYIIAAHNQDWSQSILSGFKNKIILIGHTATGTAMDLKPTAFSPQYPGVALQASAVHTILSNKFISRLPKFILFPLYFLFCLLIVTICRKMSPLKGLLYVATCMLITFEIAILSFQYARFWIPSFGFYILAPTLYLLITLMSFLKVQLEKELLNRELSLATKIQESLLPDSMPEIPQIEIAAFTLPAKHVGGDLYDIVPLSEDKWGVCIGDVSGKGVPAALFMAKSISEFRRETDVLDTSTVVSRLNDKLASDGSSGLFLTMLYLILDPAKGTFSYANGGHEPILHYKKKEGVVDLLKTDAGLPLGIMAGSDFDSKSASWEPGDVLVLQTDGVKEAMNLKREIFDFDRAKKAILEVASAPPNMIIENMHKRILEFAGGAPQHDDTTIVCIKHL